MVLSKHELERLLGVAVIFTERFLGRQVRSRDSASLELYHPYDAVIDDPDELGLYPFVDSCIAIDLQATYALGLDIDLIGQGLWAKDTPSGAIVVELLFEELPTVAKDGTAFLLRIMLA
jgi:hypothetical protein